MGIAIVGPFATGNVQPHVVDEVGHEGVVAGDITDGVSGIGRYHIAVLGPVGEGVAFVGSSRQSGRFTVVVGACAGNGTTVARIGRSSDGVAVEGPVAGHVHVVVGHGGHFTAPAAEGVAFHSRYGCSGYIRAIVVGDCSGYGRCASRHGAGVFVGHIVAVDVVRNIDRHVLVGHVAAHRGLARCIACDGG